MDLEEEGFKRLFPLRKGETISEGSKFFIAQPIKSTTKILNYGHDFLWDSSESMFFIGFQMDEIFREFVEVYNVIEMIIENRSGANDLYDVMLYNQTTDEILASWEQASINNRGSRHFHILVGEEKIKSGDVIFFIITDGIIGTTGEEAGLGQVGLCALTMTDSNSLSGIMEKKEAIE